MQIKSFRDLYVWQKAHLLALNIYKIVNEFPKSELYGLSSQLKRAVISVTSNIAEGFARRSKKEKIQFYFISLGSITEIENQLILAKDLRYLSEKIFDELFIQSDEIAKMINGLIKSIKNSYLPTTNS
ncbi:four helix bundle protein [Candidatus Roizmanbacteria bacterium CG2_30_33_16]|uniref:Four helix bundle protein n=5 Tax=Candidatus Roizmaniibacteriota TaxID=1752723 RepID=A0A2M7E506_9BACT|nr:four helix bundle protein [Candidatus Roizmanbacteria bacterium]OIP83134.1 MAG: four helix bundle protein [Candidatus Roizmanbacteria bacterium CG2_30_33_16]PIP64735.1 MAG: four helix bundle protein [Candidatus Roizmanbacteria bacterium CG22_combo_CG10-13_8_21_14_all_33_16]PIV62817.1 MAG: four helix bundle protein [Candidatus Roizmanbacteria bacterium CG01_land_8_20_14_3_00_33_9]PIX71045.1 MAG: four helix bundle protein [Candidatus Roizmanbacteria bacterium CG_4_10_14_3_um_filter_33_21]PJB8